MINYDYFIKRDEKTELMEFRPQQIPRELPNVVEVAGPNSSGKSTLLNLLALGFNGLNDNYIIKEALKEKMSNLIDSSHQKITFSISISDSEGKPELKCEKKSLNDKEIIVRDGNNKLITPELFTRKYKLIYDIPENPTERLPDLLHEIEDIQSQIGTRLGVLRAHVDEVIGNIKEARDPRQIEIKRNELAEAEEKAKSSANKIDTLKKELKKIRTFTAVKFYYQYKEEFEKLKNTLSLIKREDTKQRKEIIRISKEYKQKSDELKQEINELREMYYKITPLLKNFFDKNEKQRLQIWQDIDIDKEIMNHEIRKELKLETANFIVLLKDLKENYTKSDKDSLIKANIYNQLIELLENYKTLNIKLPGVELTIPSFIEKLKQETKQYSEIINATKNIDEALKLLTSLLQKYEDIILNLSDFIKSMKDMKPVDQLIDDGEAKFQATEARMKKAEATMDYYKMDCAKLDIKESDIEAFWPIINSKDFKVYSMDTEQDLKDNITELITEIDKIDKELIQRKDYIEYLKNYIESLEKKKPHTYQRFLPNLEKLLKIVSKMEQKLRIESQDYIRELQQKKVDKKKINREKQNYFNLVFEFLALKIGIILHINRIFKPVKIDLIEGTIFTAEGNEIKIKDMGTGQGQSAYLTGLLSSDDRRKIIALFDEVAMMDTRSLQQVHNKMKELYKSGKLLLGVIVQKADELRISPIQ